jgi:hypothetical protein
MSPRDEAKNCGQVLLASALAGIAARHPIGGWLREEMEEWARNTIPELTQRQRIASDFSPLPEDYETQLEAVLSQKEAELKLGERMMGTKAHWRSVEEALAANDVRAATEKRVFWRLSWDHTYSLDSEDVRFLLNLASRENDSRFLLRLARAVEQQPDEPEKPALDRLQGMLILWWLRCPRGEMGLCQATDPALTEFCNWAFRSSHLTLDTVRKTRQRLGLAKGTRPWFSVLKRQGEEVSFA